MGPWQCRRYMQVHSTHTEKFEKHHFGLVHQKLQEEENFAQGVFLLRLLCSARPTVSPLCPCQPCPEQTAMGYAGYVPAKTAAVRSPLDLALLQVKSVESLEVVQKLSYNTAVQPLEEKFRKVGEEMASVLVSRPGRDPAYLLVHYVTRAGATLFVHPAGEAIQREN
jgi:hypothetical protein